MKLHPGDEIVVKGHRVGDKDRVALVIEAHGADGAAPYLIEWSDSPGQHLYWPGADAQVRRRDPAPR